MKKVWKWIKWLFSGDRDHDYEGHITDYAKQRATELRSAGLSYREIGKQLGISKDTAWRWVNQ